MTVYMRRLAQILASGTSKTVCGIVLACSTTLGVQEVDSFSAVAFGDQQGNESETASSVEVPPRRPVVGVRARSAIVFDADSGEVLWERDAREPRPIASITKVMTVMLFLDHEKDLSSDVVISAVDVRRASTTYLRRGERVCLRDLVHLALMASDNVAARALARVSKWGTKRFISRMNARAAELGLQGTRFTDPSGLHEGNVSSAFDVSRLIVEASQRARVGEIMRKRSYRISTSRGDRNIRNTNRLLDSSLEVMAGKTGYIDEAGYCLATLVRFSGDQKIAVVVLGAGSSSRRFTETRRLVDWVSR